MKKIFLLASLLILTIHLKAQNNHPNILLVIADDMGIDVTNGYQENPVMPTTPTIDSLRMNGITYKNTWSSPMCTPTRAAIMSGKFGINTGVMKPPGNLNLVDTSVFNMLNKLSGATYAKALIGKWHISNPTNFNHPMEHGIDHYEGVISSSVPDYYNWEKVTNGTISNETEYTTTNFTNAAIDWVADQDQPWFLWLAHVAPHSPFHIPPEGLYSTNNTNGNQNKYIAAIEAMDHETGRLINSFDEETRKNTIIIFIGDNGTPGPVIQNFASDHAKSSLYEGGVRVPLIVSGKGVSRINEEENGLTQVSDLYATILELTGHQQQGGIHNSLSLKPSFNCNDAINRPYMYTDFQSNGILSWAIKNEQYKLIEDENGNQEFYDVDLDVLELNNLMGSLDATQQSILDQLHNEAINIRTGWSCNDGIQNGEEIGVDDCDSSCADDDTLSTENIGCCEVPQDPSVYYEYIDGNERNIYSNDFPNHNYCYNSNNIPEQTYYNFAINLTPSQATEITKVVRDNGRPARYFGVAKNGVIFAPAPATPFIFENSNTGEFNWDWVFEPTTNQGNGQAKVALDCASAHTGPQGYHYHGEMFEYLETILPGSTSDQVPSDEIHIGWASDGFPILYRFGPDTDGNLKEMLPSYQLKPGLRPGNGIAEPCGAYNGKYTNDYQFICGKGDLDECNGIESPVTLTTAAGIETFEYYYVITSSFPQISRCLVGTVSLDFENDAPKLTGVDNDNDGFLSQYDCDDNDSAINPLAIEIPDNNIDEDCDGMDTTTATTETELDAIKVYPNPFRNELAIHSKFSSTVNLSILNADGKTVFKKQIALNTKGITLDLSGLQSGIYLARFVNEKGEISFKKLVNID